MAEHQQLLMPTQLAPRQCHRLILVCCLAMSCISPAWAALPSTSPKAAPVSVNVRTAGDLAYACTVKPASRTDFARLNFCNGFAQGVLRDESAEPEWNEDLHPEPLAQTQRDHGRICRLGSGGCVSQGRLSEHGIPSVYGGTVSLHRLVVEATRRSISPATACA